MTVSDNSSSNAYDPNFKKRFPEVRFLRPEKEFLTAEENLFFGIRTLKSGLIWILGDDDEFEKALTEVLSESLEMQSKDKNCKAIFLHNHYIDENGRYLYSQVTSSPKIISKVSSRELVINNGLLNGFSGFSNWILHFTVDELASFSKELNEEFPIYSHTFRILQHVSKSKVLEVNVPLISYRKNMHDTNNSKHWLTYTKAQSKVPSYPWTINLIEKLQEAIDSLDFDPKTLRDLKEEDGSGQRFLLVSFILKRFLQDFSSYDRDLILLNAHLMKCFDFYSRYNLMPSSILTEIHLILIAANNGVGKQRLILKANKLISTIEHRESVFGPILANNYIATIGVYRLFKFDDTYRLLPINGIFKKSDDQLHGDASVERVFSSLRMALKLKVVSYEIIEGKQDKIYSDPDLLKLILLYQRFKAKLPNWMKKKVRKWLED